MRAMLAVAAVVLLAAAPEVRAQGRGPSTAKERQEALQRIHRLETDPLGRRASGDRRWLLRWLSDIPDITVNVCGYLVGDAKATRPEVSTQLVFSSAVPALERYPEVPAASEVRRRGLEGVLRVYQIVRDSDPEARSADLDALVVRQQDSTLAAYGDSVSVLRCGN